MAKNIETPKVEVPGTEQQRTLEDLSPLELKGMFYDLSAQIQQLEVQRNTVNQLIAEQSNESSDTKEE